MPTLAAGGGSNSAVHKNAHRELASARVAGLWWATGALFVGGVGWQWLVGGIVQALSRQLEAKIQSGGREESQRNKELAQWRPASRGTLEAHLAAHHCTIQWMKGSWPPQWRPASGRPLEGCWSYVCRAPSGNRLQAKSVPPEEAERRHEIGCWRPEPVKQEIRRRKEGSVDKGVGLEEESLQRQRPNSELTFVPPSG